MCVFQRHEKAELEDSLTRELNNVGESARMFERQVSSPVTVFNKIKEKRELRVIYRSGVLSITTVLIHILSIIRMLVTIEQAREAESSSSRRVAEVEGKCSTLLAANRQLEERDKYSCKKLIESEGNVAKLEISLEQACSELENSSKTHRVERRKIETEIILPLKEEVSRSPYVFNEGQLSPLLVSLLKYSLVLILYVHKTFDVVSIYCV